LAPNRHFWVASTGLRRRSRVTLFNLAKPSIYILLDEGPTVCPSRIDFLRDLPFRL